MNVHFQPHTLASNVPNAQRIATQLQANTALNVVASESNIVAIGDFTTTQVSDLRAQASALVARG